MRSKYANVVAGGDFGLAELDITYHFPPELFNLLVDTIPLLNKSKRGVLDFFTGAGISRTVLREFEQALATDREAVNKYQIVRKVLHHLNERGEACLAQRRETLKRVVEFTNFDSCWPSDQLRAKGLVASIREIVGQKDAFTRMNLEREKERKERIEQIESDQKKRVARLEKIRAARAKFFSLFSFEGSPQKRGKLLEDVLNEVFESYGVSVVRAFQLVGEAGEGVIEQVDGVIRLDGTLYFVEMKWYKDPVGKPEISEHLVRLMGRSEVRGLFISASEYTEPAIQTCREFLLHKTIAMSSLEEFVKLLDDERDLIDFLRRKVDAAQIYKNPYFQILA